MATVEQTLKLLKLERGQIKSKLTRFNTFLDKFNTLNGVSELEKRVSTIEPLLDLFDKCQTQIELLDDTEDVEEDPRCGFENTYFSLISRSQDLIDKYKNTIVASNVNPTSIMNTECGSIQSVYKKLNLPGINLPKFKGGYHEYMHFHSAFSAIIDKNTSLSKFEKFSFLKSCLEGEAAKVIESLEITDANYDDAIELIRKRYENKRVIINNHLKALFDFPVISKENAVSLRKLSDGFQSEIRALKNLGEKIEYWDSILIYLLCNKLDPSSKRQWESSIKPGLLPNIQDFSEFLNSRCVMLESVYLNQNISNSHSLSNNTHKQLQPSKKSFNNVSTASTSLQGPICRFCKESHVIYYCKRFLKLSASDRISEIKKLNLCTNCLRANGNDHSCSESRCRICNKPHNTLLHIEKNTGTLKRSAQSTNTIQSSQVLTELNEDNAQGLSINTHCSQYTESIVLLSTALIYIYDKNNQLVQCRCLLDSGSQSNFITTKLANKLNLDRNQINLPIVGINQKSSQVCHSVKSKIKSKYNGFSRELTFLILDTITGHIPLNSFLTVHLDIPQYIELADPNFSQSQDVDVLLGASIFFELLSIGQIKLGTNQPLLQRSKLGWIISGPLQLRTENKQTCLFSNNIAHSANDKLRSQIEKFWLIEEVTSTPLKTTNVHPCEEYFKQTHYRDETGRFVVALPLKPNSIDLGSTLETATKRCMNLESKLHRNIHLLEPYTKFMREYEELNHMSLLDESQIETNEPTYYLPHHGVFKQSSATTKLRVVFDASCKSSTNLSLNDVSHIGPVIQEDLFSVLLRFRKHNYVIKADITKMYRQVNISPSQRNLQRIVWREHPDLPLKHYVLNTVTYGTAPASFLAVRCLHQLAIENREQYPIASEVISSDFYMDDLISGSDNLNSVKQLKNQVSEILESAGFILTQWMSNDINALNPAEAAKIQNFCISKDGTVKALGMLWNPNLDIFQYSVDINLNSKNLTKRTILSVIAQIFDPLGLLGPIVIKAKILLQRLWQLQISWDESIPQETHMQFMQFFNALPLINELTIPRHVMSFECTEIQLHGFSDASQVAYGACIYIRSSDFRGSNHIRLLCAKSRVAPLKTVTLPRLELCGALLMARLAIKVMNALKLKIHNIFHWTDSKIVLAWLAQDPSKWKVFVAHRVAEIQNTNPTANWGHVISADNPADLISRGCCATQLKNNPLWWSGPRWLAYSRECWPEPVVVPTDPLDMPEVNKNSANINLVSTNCIDLFTKFSSLTRLLNSVAFCLRFFFNCKQPKEHRITGNLTSQEIIKSENALIKLIQAQHFAKEIAELEQGRPISRSSKLLCLNPFIDENRILRVGGRLRNSNLEFNQKFPVVLPCRHHFVDLVILHEHIRNFHSGAQGTLASIRAKYWPLHVKNRIKHVIRQCVLCFRASPKTTTPLMGDLPAFRVNDIPRPFHTAGVDFAGPLLIKEGGLRSKRLVKAYICLFICTLTKAVHIELVADMTSESFLNALKRFTARRGVPSRICSDNGSNFKGANNILSDVYQRLRTISKDAAIQTFITQNRINWQFIPARAPHFGGLWEAAIKSAKFHLTRVVGNAHLNYEALYTILTRIESILNSRPLSPLSSDPTDLEPLTPGHFLIGTRLNNIPEEDIRHVAYNRLNHYQRIQQMTQHFWKRFYMEYIHSLQQRNKWLWQDPSVLKVGALVLIKEDNLPPMSWKLGRIVQLHPGKDNIARVASVKTQGSIIKRDFSKLCLLPIEDK